MRTEDVEALIGAARTRDRAGAAAAASSTTRASSSTSRAITQAAHGARAASSGLDLAHAAGNVPLRLHDWDVDFAAWCSYKYLNAGRARIAGCFVHERHAPDIGASALRRLVGQRPATRFAMQPREFVPARGRRRLAAQQPADPGDGAAARLAGALRPRPAWPPCAGSRSSLTGYLEALLDGDPATAAPR